MNLKKLNLILLLTIYQINIFATELTSSINPDINNDGQIRILFIGNSYTYENDLPKTFESLSVAAHKNIHVESSTASNYTLEKHANPDDPVGRITLQKIREGRWDYVVLQEHSHRSTYPDLYAAMASSAQALNREIKMVGAKTLLYMTWAYQWGDNSHKDRVLNTYQEMQALMTEGYTKLGSEINAEVVPVGTAWLEFKNNWSAKGTLFFPSYVEIKSVKQAIKQIIYRDPLFLLFSPDYIHPNKAGTLLTAGVFFAHIFREDPGLIKYKYNIHPKIIDYIMDIAYESVDGK